MFESYAPLPERDPSNFDFRTVAIFTIMAIQPDLLHEYLRDGALREPDGTPAAIHNTKLWPTLRCLAVPPELLALFLPLYERKGVQVALLVTQRLFATMKGDVAY